MASPSLQTPSQVGTTVPDTAAAAAAAAALSCTPRSRTKKSSCLSSHKAAAGSTGSRRWGGKPPPPRSLQCTHLRLGAVSPVALHAVVQSTSTPVHAAGATSPGSAPRPTLLPPPPADPRPREGRCRAPGPPPPCRNFEGRYLRCRRWRGRPDRPERSGGGEPDAALALRRAGGRAGGRTPSPGPGVWARASGGAAVPAPTHAPHTCLLRLGCSSHGSRRRPSAPLRGVTLAAAGRRTGTRRNPALPAGCCLSDAGAPRSRRL